MNRSIFRALCRQARMGNLGTLATSLPRPLYIFFFAEVYDLRFPRIGNERHAFPQTFDCLASRNWVRGSLRKVNGRLCRA
jgi:hypothetical protein